jgi:hypothetical protein
MTVSELVRALQGFRWIARALAVVANSDDMEAEPVAATDHQQALRAAG